ncbi:MAG: helix-turn-helix domain-containing protein [Verrucomicrobiales bacterium]
MRNLSKSEIENALKNGDRLAYRLKEVSILIGIPVSTLRKMIHRGEINPIVAFGTWLVLAEDLAELLTKRLH